MDSGIGEADGGGEEATGRKKSRFKQLKTRLFSRLKRKEAGGAMKQSQSTSDVTAPQTGRGGGDSEDEYSQGTLGSRALSHDSIFLAEQLQPSPPTRVLSNENVHSKIKVLQLRLQEQSLRLGPPPLLIPGKRIEDTGATSEDDGLPCSPPEILLSGGGHRSTLRSPDPHKHLSSLSLAGTGSEEEEQGSSQPSSRPLSPVRLNLPESPGPLSPGVDFSSPAQFMPSLNTSAARHRLAVKPRNQRVSTRGKRPTGLYRPRSESMTDLQLPLSEGDEEVETSAGSVRGRSYSAQAPRTPASPSSTCLSPLTLGGSHSTLPARPEEPREPAGRVTTNPLFLQPLPQILVPSEVTPAATALSRPFRPDAESLQVESFEPNHTPDMTPVLLDPDSRANTANEPASEGPGPASDTLQGGQAMRARVTGGMDSMSVDHRGRGSMPLNAQVLAPAMTPEVIPRLQPVPVPRVKKPTVGARNPAVPATTLESPPGTEEKEKAHAGPIMKITAPPKVQEDLPPSSGPQESKLQRPLSGSFRFSIAPAKNRGKTSSEAEVQSDKGKMRDSLKTEMPSFDQDSKQHPDKMEEEAKLKEVLGTQPSSEEKRTSLRRSVTSRAASKDTGGGRPGDGGKGTTDHEGEKDKAGGNEERRGAFGVQLRTTSMSLKYRSESAKSETRCKRHSLEAQSMHATPEDQRAVHAGNPQSSTDKNESRSDLPTKPALPRKPLSPSTESSVTNVLTATVAASAAKSKEEGKASRLVDSPDPHTDSAVDSDRGSSARTPPGQVEAEGASEPAWLSLAREKTRHHHLHLSTRPSTTDSQAPPPTDPPAHGTTQLPPVSRPPNPTQSGTQAVPTPPPEGGVHQQLLQQQQLVAPRANTEIRGSTKWRADQPNPNRSDKPAEDGKAFTVPLQAQGRAGDRPNQAAPAEPEISRRILGGGETITRRETSTHNYTTASTAKPEMPGAQVSPNSLSDTSQPMWMELAKRKSLAWSDKNMD